MAFFTAFYQSPRTIYLAYRKATVNRDDIGNISDLSTDDKTSIVAAVNENHRRIIRKLAAMGNDTATQAFPEISGKLLWSIEVDGQPYGRDFFEVDEDMVTVTWLTPGQTFHGNMVLDYGETEFS